MERPWGLVPKAWAAIQRELAIFRTSSWPSVWHPSFFGLHEVFWRMSERPSFGPGSMWDLRAFRGELKLFESGLISNYDATGYREMEADPGELQKILDGLAEIEIRFCPSEFQGLDGTSYTLSIEGPLEPRSKIRWWEDGPPEWRGLTGRIQSAIQEFKKLKPAKSPLNETIDLPAVEKRGFTPLFGPERPPRVWRQFRFTPRMYNVHLTALGESHLDLTRPHLRFLVVVECADMTAALRQQLAKSMTVSPPERIVAYVNVRASEIQAQPTSFERYGDLFKSEAAYFLLDQSCGSRIDESAQKALAVHISGDLPPLSLGLWAIS